MNYCEAIILDEKFSKSTNILLDKFDKEKFIETASLKEIKSKLNSKFSENSFALIGPFGSGKSTILLYLEEYFKENNFEVVKILGDFKDFNEVEITLKENQVILIDEFNKFIEYAYLNNKTLFKLQNIAEWVNRHNCKLFITMHKSFADYLKDFSEIEKIQGRFENILIRDDYVEM